MMNRERQNRFYGSLPGPVPSGFMRHEASHASSGTRDNAAGDTIQDLREELRQQGRTISYLQDQVDQAIALGDTTVK